MKKKQKVGERKKINPCVDVSETFKYFRYC